MEIIPVLDLMHGQVVRAQQGNRHLYQPIRSLLCDSCAPMQVAEALLGLYPFKKLYIADLDAIRDKGDHLAEITALHERFNDVEIWLDAGFTQPDQMDAALQRGLRCIIPSERLTALTQYQLLMTHAAPGKAILSLDFNQVGFLGPAPLPDLSQAWPESLICMTLGRVGSYAGPDFERLQQLLGQAGGKHVYAAGGVRDAADLERLAHAGVHGALVASALHDGKITPEQIARCMQ